MKHIFEHFRKNDSVLYEVSKKVNLTDFLTPAKYNLFTRLCRTVIGQQLSGKVAETIFTRFVKLYPKGKITAEKTLTLEEQKLRDCGMAWSKVRSIKDIAQKVVSKEIQLQALKNVSNEEVIVTLSKLKGVGPWTAEMFLMFTLRRPDIFSHGDYGLQKAIVKLYGFKKKPSQRTVERLAKKWSPYRSYACMILWQSLEL